MSRSEWALVGVTMIWGTTFLIISRAMTVSGPLFFVGLRFAFASLVTLGLWWRVLRGMTRQDLLAGLVIGVSIFAGFTLQTYGLQTIPSSKSAFITALYVPLVPLFQWLILKRPPLAMSWVGVALAFGGLVLLAGPEGASLGLGTGELLTIASTVAIALEIILISMFAGQVDVRRVTFLQLVVTSVMAFAAMPLLGEPVPGFSWLLVLSAGGLGVASALIQLVMNWAQKEVSPTRATVIYAAEPVWAGVVGRIAGERLPALALVGGALVVFGVIASELRWKRPAKPEAAGVVRETSRLGEATPVPFPQATP